ncbi:MAG: hypothetical protein DI570_05370, partial [Phenylobacterium zucineum]
MFETGEREGASVESAEGRSGVSKQDQAQGTAPAKSPDAPLSVNMDLQGIGALLAVVFAVYAILAQARRSTLLLPFIIVSLLASSGAFCGYCAFLTWQLIQNSKPHDSSDVFSVVSSGQFIFFIFSGLLFAKLLQDYT